MYINVDGTIHPDHLRNDYPAVIYKYEERNYPWRDKKPCRHNSCQECHGSGRKKNGQICPHMLVCNCERCVPYSC